MKTSFHRVTTADRLILDGLLFEPERERKSRKAVLHVHGMGGNFYENHFLDEMARQYTAAGYAFCTGNNRGHDLIADFKVAGPKEKYKRIGNSRERFEDCVLDIKAWAKLLKQKGYTKLALQGHSLGCSKVAYYLYKTNDPLVGALILASPTDMIGINRVGKEMKKFLRDRALAKKMVKQGKGKELLPRLLWGWYYLSARTYLNFCDDGATIDIFSILNHKNADFKILKSLKVPIFAFFGGGKGETGQATRSKEKALQILKANALSAPRFDYAVIGRASHSYFGYEKEVARKVIAWLRKVAR